MSHRLARSAAARACPQPRVQEEGDGFRNPRVAGHPATHRPFIDAQTPGSLHLVQVQPAEGIAELLRRHGHNAVGKVPVARSQGKLPQPTWGSALSNRAICPRLPARCLVISQTRQPGTSAGRLSCWRSSSTTCAFRRRASWGAGITSCWSWRRAAGCGWQRPSLSRRQRAVEFASCRNACGWRGSCSGSPSLSLAELPTWCGRRGGACEACCDLSLYCERSDCNSPHQPAHDERTCGGRGLQRDDANAASIGGTCILWPGCRCALPLGTA